MRQTTKEPLKLATTSNRSQDPPFKNQFWSKSKKWEPCRSSRLLLCSEGLTNQ